MEKTLTDIAARNDAAYKEFQLAVSKARPDLEFAFDRGPDFNASWSFPGAKFGGGTVGWIWGSQTLCWGMSLHDIAAWEAYEKLAGREPRWD